MAVRKIRSSWWVDFRFGGVRHRKRSPDQSRQGALVYEATLRQRLAKGEPIDGPEPSGPSAPSLATFADEWMTTYSRPNNKRSTVRSKEQILRRHLVPAFGDVALDRIGNADIERYKAAKLKQGLNPHSINNHLIVLRKLLRTAHDWARTGAVPKVKLLRETLPRPKFLSPEDAGRLLADRSEPLAYEMTLLALRTGLRIGEIQGLDWSDVDLHRHFLVVRRAFVEGELSTPKSGKARHVPLTRDLHEVLRHREPKHGFVFAAPSGGPLQRWRADDLLERQCRRTAVGPVTWHVLRHTFASHLAMANVSLLVIRDLLGHADLRMVLRYAHLTPATLHQAVSVLERSSLGQPVGNGFEPAPGRESAEDGESPVFIGRSSAQPYPATQIP